MGSRAADWWAQAQRDLRMAEVALREQSYEWACFCAQQAAEKAVKALHLALGQDAWGHTVAKLLEELPCSLPQELVERARFLDLYYVPSRYPNGFPEGAPFQHFGPQQGEQALAHARAILEFVASQMA